jgi:hypothetical protein
MISYQQMREEVHLDQNKAIYVTCVCTLINFLILFIIAVMLGPVAHDAGILINDAGKSLVDLSIMIPEINHLIPEARNTTRILGHMIPKINQGMYILRQLCNQDPACHLH